MSSLFLAPYVVMQRLPQLWFEALHPNPMVSDESSRAVTEKVTAVSEGMLAAHVEACKTPFMMGLALLNGHSPASAALGAPRRIAKAALAPLEREVTANVKRLTKEKRR